jgi:hypothetical protein
VDQADRVERSGHAEPEDAHFVHWEVANTSIGCSTPAGPGTQTQNKFAR